MNQHIARTAQADQIHAGLKRTRCCDALDPCDSCRAEADQVKAARHAARVAAVVASQPAKVAQ